MSLLKPSTGGGYLKAGFLGFAGSGKTHTALDLAIGARAMFGLAGPIAMFDTEGGSDYHATRVRKATGLDLLAAKSRSLADLMDTAQECMDAGVSVLIVDSITHVWREVCESFLRELQEAARKKNWRVPERMEFQDWAKVKARWQAWPDWYLNSRMHVIVCGRAGYEYDYETNERNKKELVKTGVKMKVEGEFGFEPSLLVQMERDWDNSDPPKMVNVARVIKDRFDVVDGQEQERPTFAFFKPHVERLIPAAHTPVDVAGKTQFGLDEHRADDWQREREQREIMAEKIQAALTKLWPGQTAAERKSKVEAIEKHWHTTSWKELSEKTPSASMAQGLMRFELEHNIGDHPPDMNVAEGQ